MGIVNFGIVKTNVMNSFSSSLIKENKENMELDKFISVLVKSPILMKEFIVYNNIQNKSIKDDYLATKYIDENVSLFKDVTYNAIIEEHKKLEDFVLEDELTGDIVKLFESIQNLIVENSIKKGIKSVDKIHSSFECVLNHIKNNDKEELNESVSEIEDIEYSDVIINMVIQNYNTEYSSLDENEILILKSIIEENVTEKEVVFNRILTETKDKISSLIDISGSDNDNQVKIVKTLNKLNEMVFNEVSYNNDVVKLNELNKGL